VSLESKLDQLMEDYITGDSPGLAMLIGQGGAILLAKGYGLADVEKRVPNEAGTRFIIGSVTKQFTCMVVMMLKERGLLDLDDPVSDYITDFPAWANEVTLRHLMTHTGGVHEYLTREFWEESQEAETEFDLQAVLDRIRTFKELDFEPGTRWDYSNSGYILLQGVIEQVSGQDFSSFMEEKIFKPLGMENTTAGVVGNRDTLATGYSYESPSEFSATPFNSSVVGWADGNIISTVEDMYLWDQALYTDRLVSPHLLAQAFTPVNPEDPSLSRYGYGWFISSRRGLQEVHHAGGTLGFVSNFCRFVDEKTCIVLLSNAAGIDLAEITGRIAELVLGDKMERVEVLAEVPHAWLQEKVGRYEAAHPSRGGVPPWLELGFDGEGNLQFADGHPRSRTPCKLVPLERDRFRLDSPADHYVTFIRCDETGELSRLRLDSGGRVMTLIKEGVSA